MKRNLINSAVLTAILVFMGSIFYVATKTSLDLQAQLLAAIPQTLPPGSSTGVTLAIDLNNGVDKEQVNELVSPGGSLPANSTGRLIVLVWQWILDGSSFAFLDVPHNEESTTNPHQVNFNDARNHASLENNLPLKTDPADCVAPPCGEYNGALTHTAVPQHINQDITEELSIASWVRPQQAPSQKPGAGASGSSDPGLGGAVSIQGPPTPLHMYIVSKSCVNEGNYNLFLVEGAINTEYKVGFSYHDGTNDVEYITDQTIPADQWTHLVATWDFRQHSTAGSEPGIYFNGSTEINGQPITGTWSNAPSGLPTTHDNTMAIGTQLIDGAAATCSGPMGTPTNTFLGRIDLTKAYPTIINADEVFLLHQLENANLTGLLGQERMAGLPQLHSSRSILGTEYNLRIHAIVGADILSFTSDNTVTIVDQSLQLDIDPASPAVDIKLFDVNGVNAATPIAINTGTLTQDPIPASTFRVELAALPTGLEVADSPAYNKLNARQLEFDIDQGEDKAITVLLRAPAPPGTTPGITVNPTTGLSTTESGGSDTFTVVLDTQPTDDVTFVLSSSNTAEGTVSPTSLTFTPTNWNTAQTATVTGVDDTATDGDIAYTIVTDPDTTTADANYNGLDPDDVSVTNKDDDTLGGVTPPSGSAIITHLNAPGFPKGVSGQQNIGTVMIEVSSCPNPTEAYFIKVVNALSTTGPPVTLIKTACQNLLSGQPALPELEDIIFDDARYLFTLVSSQGTSYQDIFLDSGQVLITADFTPAITPDMVEVTIDTPANQQGNVIEIQLLNNVMQATGREPIPYWWIVDPAQPTITVHMEADQLVALVYAIDVPNRQIVAAAIQRETITIGTPVSIDFSNFLTQNQITPVPIGPGPVSPPAVTPPTVGPAGVTVDPISGLMTSELGAAATFTVVLDTQPTDDVTFVLSSSNTAEGTVSPTSLTFTPTNWNTAQTATVTGVDDTVEDAMTMYQAEIAPDTTTTDVDYNGLDPHDVTIINLDDETITFPVHLNAPGFSAGTTGQQNVGTVKIDVASCPNPTEPYFITVVDRSSQFKLQLQVPCSSLLPSEPPLPQLSNIVFDDKTYVFTLMSTQGTQMANQVLDTSNLQLTIDLTPATTSTAVPVAIETPLDQRGLVIELRMLDTRNVGSGTSQIPFWQIVDPTQTGVTFLAEPPPRLTLNIFAIDPANAHIVAFHATVVDVTGPMNVNLKDLFTAHTVPTPIPIGPMVSIPTPPNTPGVTVDPTAGLMTSEAGATAAFELVLDTQPTADVTIALRSSNTAEGTVTPSVLTFTPANWNTPQAATITGVDDTAQDGHVSYTIVTSPDTTTADVDYNGLDPDDVSVLNVDDDTTTIPTHLSTIGFPSGTAGQTGVGSVKLQVASCPNPTELYFIGIANNAGAFVEQIETPCSSLLPSEPPLPQLSNIVFDDKTYVFTLLSTQGTRVGVETLKIANAGTGSTGVDLTPRTSGNAHVVTIETPTNQRGMVLELRMLDTMNFSSGVSDIPFWQVVDPAQTVVTFPAEPPEKLVAALMAIDATNSQIVAIQAETVNISGPTTLDFKDLFTNNTLAVPLPIGPIAPTGSAPPPPSGPTALQLLTGVSSSVQGVIQINLEADFKNWLNTNPSESNVLRSFMKFIDTTILGHPSP